VTTLLLVCCHLKLSHLMILQAEVNVRTTYVKLEILPECYLKVKPWSRWLITAGAYPGFCSMKRLGVFLLPLDGMLVHRRSLPCNLLGFPNNSPVPIFTLGWREALKVKCLAQEHNTVSPARVRTQTVHSGVKHINHEATVPPLKVMFKVIQQHAN